MTDRYEALRNIPLRDVLAQFGFTGFRKRGGKAEHYGSCPFHEAKKNKTSFSFTDEKFNCFSCGEHGSGAIDLTMKLKKIGFNEAVNVLGGLSANPRDSRTETPRETAPKSNRPFEGKYEKFYVPSDWLKARGISERALTHYGVGEYHNPARKSAVTGKVLFPILRFDDGVKTGYLSREIYDSEKPKYVFPNGFHKSLEMFGSWQLRQSLPQGQARHRLGFVVESPLCVMRFFDYGFPAVSPYGAFLSEAQLEILQSLFVGILYLPDRDKSPESLHVSAQLARRLWVKAPGLPDGVDDPEHLNREQLLQLMKSLS